MLDYVEKASYGKHSSLFVGEEREKKV